MADVELVVNQAHASASDTGPGTEATPLKTCAEAAIRARAANQLTQTVRVRVFPGVYRETITVPQEAGITTAQIEWVGEGDRDAVIVSGALRWRYWRYLGDRLYETVWPFLLTLSPSGSLPGATELAQRREMVYVNGVRLIQVLTEAAMVEGSFWVDEPNRRIVADFPQGIDPNADLVEIPILNQCFASTSRDNHLVRGMTFKMCATSTPGTTLAIVNFNNGLNCLVEDCVVRDGNWLGLTMSGTTNFTVRDCILEHCGGQGGNAFQPHDMLFEDVEARYNNWRGVMGGFTGWSVAGIKHTRVHGATYRRVNAHHNDAKGIWMDYDCKNLTFDDVECTDNLGHGLVTEVSQGPILIDGGTFARNTLAGISMADSENVTLKNARIFGNTTAGLVATPGAAINTTDHETLQVINLRGRNLVIQANYIRHPTRVIDIDGLVERWSTIVLGRNLYVCPGATPFEKDGVAYSFADWRTQTTEDADSRLNGEL